MCVPSVRPLVRYKPSYKVFRMELIEKTIQANKTCVKQAKMDSIVYFDALTLTNVDFCIMFLSLNKLRLKLCQAQV